MTLISSRSNDKIKSVRALHRRKARRKSGLFIVEGIRHIGEAMEASAKISYLLYAPDLLQSKYALQLIEEADGRGIACYPTTKDVFYSIAERENPQGLLAIIQQPRYSLRDLDAKNFPWGVALVSPQDPGNIGVILRTIDAVGANGLILLDESADPYHPTAVRASMGTLFWHPVVKATFEEFANWTKEHNFTIYGTSAHGNTDYRTAKYKRPCILLMGSERQGLTPEQASLCERIIRMPMRGHATSLNLAVATGIMLYKMLDCSKLQQLTTGY